MAYAGLYRPFFAHKSASMTPPDIPLPDKLNNAGNGRPLAVIDLSTSEKLKVSSLSDHLVLLEYSRSSACVYKTQTAHEE